MVLGSVEEVRTQLTKEKMKEAIYAINRLVMSDDECARGGLADIMEDDEILKLWHAKKALADALGWE